jgi:TonB family protein
LGQAYSNGRGVARDAQLALSAFERACDLGLTAGCDRLARQIQRGRGSRREAAGADTGGGRRAGQRAFGTDERPIRVGGSTAPVKVKDVDAVYPPAARVARIQGVVIIEATINSSGKVVATKILRSVRALDEAAEQAVRQWEFAPTVINGVARSVVTTVTVNFSLQ